jgi:hypothetical protein
MESEAAAAAQVQAGLQKQLREQTSELAAAKVDAENKAVQVGKHGHTVSGDSQQDLFGRQSFSSLTVHDSTLQRMRAGCHPW